MTFSDARSMTGGCPLSCVALIQFRRQGETLALIHSDKLAGAACIHVLLVGKTAGHTRLENAGVAVHISNPREREVFRRPAPQAKVSDQTAAE